MSQQTNTSTKIRISRRAAQMAFEELSPHTVKRGVILEKPRRRESQLTDAALARASAILHSPHASPLVTPTSSSTSRAKVNQQIMLQHFASLDIEMVYQLSDNEEEDGMKDCGENYQKDRSDSMDMALAFYSDH